MLHNFSRLAVAGLCFCAGALWSPAQPAAVPTPPPPIPQVAAPAAVPVAAPAAPAEGAAKIQFASTVHDFGKVSAGEVVRADFVFTNIGTQTLEIKEVRPTCGCTTAGTWEKLIAPGKTGIIPLQVNTANFSGPVIKSVSVTCNDPAQSFINLQVKGTIWKPIDVAPPFVMFNVAPDAASNEVRTVKITSNLEEALELSPPQVSSAAFRAEIVAVRPGKEFDLQITTVTPLPAGNAQASITVKTSATNLPLISITALAVVQPPVTATPGQVFLPAGPLATPAQYTIIVQNNSTQAMSLTDASINQPNVQLQVREAQSNRVFHVSLTFPAGFQIPGGQSGTLSLKTTHPAMPVMSIPVIQPPSVTPPMPTPMPVPPPPPSIARPVTGVPMMPAPPPGTLPGVVPSAPPGIAPGVVSGAPRPPRPQLLPPRPMPPLAPTQ